MSDSALSFYGTTELEAVAYAKAQEIFTMLSLQASSYEPVSRGSVDIMAVIDRSGSMAGSKLNLVKQTLKFMVEQLKDTDRIGIVTFDNEVQIPLELQKQNELGKKHTIQAIDALKTGGSTNLCGGLVQGILQMRNRTDIADISSLLLFTDGQANVGYVSAPDIRACMLDTGDLATSAISNSSSRIGPPQRIPQASGMSLRNPFNFRNRAQVQTQAPAPPQAPQIQTPIRSPEVVPTESNLVSTNTPLPCSVYTFGYGSDHDPTLLKSIADYGDGIYYYIENNDKIAEAFADCLGGLLSTTAKDICVEVTAKDGASISKVHSKYKQEKLEAGKKYRIRIGDIQSEEQKDLLFSINLPALSAAHEQDCSYQFLEASLTYTNVIEDNKLVQEQLTLGVARPAVEPEGQQVNYMLDKQRNRVLAADAMDAASRMADGGDLAGAKRLIDDTIQKITESVSGSDPYSQDLLKDLNECKHNLRDVRVWQSTGSKAVQNSVSAHYQQRSSNMSSEAQSTYHTASRKMMKSKFM